MTKTCSQFAGYHYMQRMTLNSNKGNHFF